jgi:hypothetical protein
MYMNTIFNKTADTVVCHLALLYCWLKEETLVIRYHIREASNNHKIWPYRVSLV